MINTTLLQNLRKARHLTQEDMAEKLGIASSTYARMERGQVPPRIDRLQQLAQVLQTEVAALLAQHDNKLQ